MTTATLPRLTAYPESLRRVSRFVADFIGGVLEAREIEARYFQLTRMTNAELARMGLARQDIPRAAVFGVAGL